MQFIFKSFAQMLANELQVQFKYEFFIEKSYWKEG